MTLIPYAATGLGDFWNRWHISLSTWFKDYVYFPLGGSRHGTMRTYVNMFITMVGGMAMPAIRSPRDTSSLPKCSRKIRSFGPRSRTRPAPNGTDDETDLGGTAQPVLEQGAK